MASQLVGLNRVTGTLQGFQLLSPDDMFAALSYLTQGAYTGQITAQRIGAELRWSMYINDDIQNISANAFVNDWIILENGVTATVCPAAKFAALYQQG